MGIEEINRFVCMNTLTKKIQAKTIWFARENALSFLLLQQIASCECFVCLGVMNRDGLTQYFRYIAILFAPYKQHKIIQNKNSSFCGKKLTEFLCQGFLDENINKF